MKKKYNLLIIIGLILLLTGCGTRLSDDELVGIWDKNVSLFADFNIGLITGKNLTEEQIFKQIEIDKEIIKQSTKELESAKGNKKILNAVIDINDIILLTYDNAEKSIKGNNLKKDEEESSYKLGVKNREFADDYNNGVMSSSILTLTKLSTGNSVTDTDSTQETVESEEKVTSKTNNSSPEDAGGDISKLSKTPTDEQKETLLILANQQFKQDFPYKGSKLHSVLGVLQDWTQDGESWYYKSQATIVNAYGAKEDVNVEIFITPTSPDTGKVEIISY